MFNKGEGRIVDPFKFTCKQRELITHCFGGPIYESHKIIKCDDFINQLQKIISFWLEITKDKTPSNSKLEIQYNRIFDKCNQLITAVETLDDVQNDGFSSELFWYYRKNKIDLSLDNTELAIHSLKTVAEDLANRCKYRSDSKSSEKHLVDTIANCYQQVFESAPGSGAESNFSKVINVIAEITSITIGQTIINEIASKHHTKTS